MALAQQVRDLELCRTGAGLVTRLHADETEAHAVSGITTGQSVHHGAQRDIGVLVLVAAEHRTLWRHHTDHLEGLGSDAELLPQRFAGGKQLAP